MRALIIVVAAACGNGSATPPPQHTAVSDGAVLYMKFCAQCHGVDAKGYKSDHAPSLVNPTFLESATDLFLTRSIEAGRPGTAMAGYGKTIGGPLDVVSAQKIVAWLRTQGKRVQMIPPVDGTALPFGSAAGRGQAPTVDGTALPFGSAAGRGQAPTVDGTALPFGSAAGRGQAPTVDGTALPFGSAAGRGQAPTVDGTALPFGSAAGRGQAPTVDGTALPFGSAAGRGQAPTVDETEHGDAARGQPIYTTNCLKCHGDATSRGDAIHLANAKFLELASDAFMRHAIVNGRPGTLMVAWQGKLSDQDIGDVIAYVRTFGQPPAIGALPPPTGTEPLFINPDGHDPTFTMHGDPCPAGTPCKPDLRFVPADQVKQALDQKRKLVIIDARPASEWMRVHITGAVSIPHYDLKRLDEIPKSAWIVAYCACPHHLSGIVVDELRKRGYTHAEVLDEGILEWQRRGYPVVAAPGVTTPPKEPAAAPVR